VRVLMVVYCFPPMMVPASICYAKLVNGLRRTGVDVEVLAIDPMTFDSPGTPFDPELAMRLPEDVPLHLVRSPELSFWFKVANRLDPQHHFTYRWLEPRKREWTYPAARRLRSLDLRGFDVLLTCSQPHANHLLGLGPHEKHRIPWVAYFSDPWSGNPYTLFRTEKVRAYQYRLEAEVMRSADLVLFTCEEMRDFVIQAQPALRADRTGVLPHAFVPEWYHDPARSGPDAGDRPVRVLHTGSFYGPRSPVPLIESLERLGGAQRLRGRLRLDHFGAIADEHVARIHASGLQDVFIVHDFVPYLRTLEMMSESDALLLVDAPLTSMAESVFLPSKLVDYLGARRPIIAVTPSQGATARVTREVGGTLCPQEDPLALDRALETTMRNRASASTLDETMVRRYEDSVVAEDLVQMMQTRL
jgi:hypothetical protein